LHPNSHESGYRHAKRVPRNARIAGFEVAHFGPEVLKAVKTVVLITTRSVSERFLETLPKAQKYNPSLTRRVGVGLKPAAKKAAASGRPVHLGPLAGASSLDKRTAAAGEN
jgi:hypothetical protein